MNGLGDDFAVRLRQLRQATEAEGKQAEGQKSQSDKRAVPNGLGLAARITTELVAAVLVGALLGWWLDGVFGTSPWLLLVFFVAWICRRSAQYCAGCIASRAGCKAE